MLLKKSIGVCEMEHSVRTDTSESLQSEQRVVKCLTSIHEALGSTPIPQETRKKRREKREKGFPNSQ